ncbi:MAG: hypothetical protein CM1200mP41_36260 [Gammaproteobacteria bacterium]|nr:MAG: hypothetical protein CM1200mP41_36260 [Gammaproteobacteria bacterium]
MVSAPNQRESARKRTRARAARVGVRQGGSGLQQAPGRCLRIIRHHLNAVG